ncbi:MAG: methyl-accepting chemotaxis protein [Defluviitaleaceae bacterium]|nr:methyl-accepting chemotaxis protein [Defluviitaleaceae bacterium]
MRKYYNNLKIRAKILFGFCVVIIIMLLMITYTLVGLIGIIHSHENLASGHFLRRDTRYDYRHAFEAMQGHTNAMLMYAGIDDADNIELASYRAYEAFLDALSSLEAYNSLVIRDNDIPIQEKELRLVASNQVAAILEDYYRNVILIVLQYALGGDVAAGIQTIRDGQIISNHLYESNEFLNGISDVWIAGIEADNNRNQTLTYLIITIALISIVLVSIIITILTANSISKPIKKLSEYALDVSRGNFSASAKSNNRDEMSRLQNLIVDMTEPIDRLIHDLDYIRREAEKGGLSMRVNIDGYMGSYQEAAEGINRVLDMFVDNTMELLNTFEDYAHGNFDKTLRPLEGESKIFNETANEMQKELKNIYQTVLQVVDSGDLHYRLDPTKHKGDWNTLVSSLNQLLESFTIPISEAKDALQEISNGNLSVKVTGSYQGDFAIIAGAINSTVNTLNNYISEMSLVLSAIADKDLTPCITSEYLGDFSEMKRSLNNIAQNLNIILGEIDVSSLKISEGIGKISDINQSLDRGASEQNEALNHLNGLMSVMLEKTRKQSESAAQADSLALLSRQSADTGSEDMKGLLIAMDAINESSENIAKVIKVIEDIAFRINLLALNAAVEAARAGKHGSGFAVVAEEVRALANRSQDSATETKNLIETSIAKTRQGSIIANKTANTLEQVISSVNDISCIITDVSNSSAEQTEMINDINEFVSRISSVTASNTSIIEEGVSVSQNINSQTETFRSVVSEFKLRR